MSAAPIEPPLPEASSPRKRFSNLRGVRWRIGLGILPSSPSASIGDLRRVGADSRRRYASLRRRLLIDPHLPKDEKRFPGPTMDNPLSQNPDSTWSRFFRNAELEKMVDQDLCRLYPEDRSYFQTPACQAMLRRILLVWCLRHPEYGYQQGMHELLAPLVYVLHVDLDHLSQVRKQHEDCFNDEFDGISFPEGDLISNYRFKKAGKWNSMSDKGNDHQSAPQICSLDELDPDTKDIFLLSDAYGAEGELGVILSERFMEHDAYCMFDGLMSGVHGVVAMAEFFSPSANIGSSTGLPPVIEASSALYHLLCIVDSSLHNHLVELGVEPQYFSLRWLRVLFGREFCLDDLLIVWDELFDSSNSMCRSNDIDYSFKVLCSARGAFIAAIAVSMLLHLRSSLLATENATVCLQRLLSFPKNFDMTKLIDKAKALQVLALDANVSSSSFQSSSNRNNCAITRGYSLPTGSASPKTPVHLVPDSYWEEKWRVLHRAESDKDSGSSQTKKQSLGARFGLSRTESTPPTTKTASRVKDSGSSIRRRLLDDLTPDTNKSVADDGNSRYDEVHVISNENASLPVEVIEEKLFPEPADQNTLRRASDCMAEETCISGENSSLFSTATSPQSVGNDNDNDSEKSSVTSNSFIGDNDEEVIHTEESCSHSCDNYVVPDIKTTSSVKTDPDGSLEKTAASKERKSLSGKFQWLWKLGKGSAEGNMEKESQPPATRNTIKDVSCTLASDGCCDSCGVSRRIDASDKKVMGTLKNLGQSMLENIQVIESVFQQDRGQPSSLENISSNILAGKGQVTAMAALKELRKISNLLCEMRVEL
ncbi:uncharacterized protein [Typha angustifolia]|uniref:uncharacterized protein n=1 Tax=Typha angustifolia TaxID=59011 RepID=UPI003C30C94C